MPRSHRIHVNGEGGSIRPFGTIHETITINVRVGTCAAVSELLSTIKLIPNEVGDKLQYVMEIDGQVYRHKTYDKILKQFYQTNGRTINGSIRSQKVRDAKRNKR